MNPPLLLTIALLFIIVAISYSINRIDHISVSIIISLIAAILTGIYTNADFNFFLNEIGFQALIVIFCMDIITILATKAHILEYLAIKLFEISKGRRRFFFYSLCLISTLLAAIISDIVVIMILVPVVIKMCRILKIEAGTYLLGMGISIHIGASLTPFSDAKNIIISSTFGLDTFFFIQHFWLFSFVLLFITIIIMERLFIKKEQKIEPNQRKLVLEMINSEIVIEDKKVFYVNLIAIVITIILFIFIHELYLIAAFSAFILIIINRGFTKKKAEELFKELNWDIIFFFIALYILVACLKAAGFRDFLMVIPFEKLPLQVLLLFLLIFLCIINAFVTNNATAVFFIPFIEALISNYNFPPIPLFFVFIFSINMGGNLIPTGSSTHVFLLKTAQNRNVKNLDYKRFIKVSTTLTIMHILLTFGYLLLISS